MDDKGQPNRLKLIKRYHSGQSRSSSEVAGDYKQEELKVSSNGSLFFKADNDDSLNTEKNQESYRDNELNFRSPIGNFEETASASSNVSDSKAYLSFNE